MPVTNRLFNYNQACHSMYPFTNPYQHAPYQHLGYPALTPYVYNYNTPSYDPHMPRESTGGYLGGEKDKRRAGHIYPQTQQSYTKQIEEPIDSRYFHIEGSYVPVQIVDADRLRQDREEKESDERRRLEWRDNNSPMRESWESTGYSRKVSYRHSSSQHRDRHSYGHRCTTRIYRTNPVESTLQPSQHGTGKYFVREEWVSRVKAHEVYQSTKGPGESRDERSRTARHETKKSQWGKGHLRTKD